jgi:hypothetical protein
MREKPGHVSTQVDGFRVSVVTTFRWYIVLPFADVFGICCICSQCSTVRLQADLAAAVFPASSGCPPDVSGMVLRDPVSPRDPDTRSVGPAPRPEVLKAERQASPKKHNISVTASRL